MTWPRAYTKTSSTISTSAPFVPASWEGDLECGLASCVGLCSISVVSRSGPPTKGPLPRTTPGNPTTRIALLLLVPGDALAVISRTRSSRLLTLAGVRKKRIHDLSPVYPHTRVVRRVRALARVVRIHATPFAMPDHVHLAPRWDLLRTAFAVGTHRQNDARIPIMNMAGAAEKSAEICCHAVNIHVPCHATRAYAVLAMSRSKLVVTVVNYRPTCCAARRTRRWKANLHVVMAQKRNGLVASAAMKHAIANSIAAFTHARSNVILRSQLPLIARNHRTSSFAVHVARRLSPVYLALFLVQVAKTRFRTA